MSIPNTVLDTRFRAALDRMAEQGRLNTYTAPADPNLEVAGIMKKLDGGAAPAAGNSLQGGSATSTCGPWTSWTTMKPSSPPPTGRQYGTLPPALGPATESATM